MQCHYALAQSKQARADRVQWRAQGALVFLSECFQKKGNGAVSFDDVRYASIKQVAFDALTGIGIKAWDCIQKLE